MNKNLLVAATLLALTTATSAQVYGVVSLGTARLDIDCAGAAKCDKSGTAVKLLGGYKFTPNLAAEAGYFGLGKASVVDAGTSLDITNTGFGGGIAFHQDLGTAWNFVGRLGLASVKTKLDASVSGVGSGSDSDTNVQPYGGLGIGYKLGKATTLDAVWDFSKAKFSKNGVEESGSINAFSVGLTFGF